VRLSRVGQFDGRNERQMVRRDARLAAPVNGDIDDRCAMQRENAIQRKQRRERRKRRERALLSELRRMRAQLASACARDVEIACDHGRKIGPAPDDLEQTRELLVALGAPDDRTRELGKRLSNSVRSHFLSMRDDAFVAAVAREIEKRL
jgi:hypothetical protein